MTSNMDIAKQVSALAYKYKNYTAKNLSSIVKIKSLSCGEKKVIEKLKSLLHQAKFDDVWVDGLGNLVGQIGKGKKKLAFDAHIDTVDTGDLSQWNVKPFSGLIKDSKVWGRGTVDQKGGAASMITAGRILKEMKYKGDFSLFFTFTVMEEDCDGLCWNYLIEKEKIKPDFAVITEPTNLGLYRGHRGRMEIEIYHKGVSCHGSAPERGDNAIYKAAETALRIRELHERLQYDDFLGKGSVSPTLIQSDSPSLCAIADKCRTHLDRRLTWGETKDLAIAQVRELVTEETVIEVPMYDSKSYKNKVYKQEKYFPTWKIEEDHHLVEAGKFCYRALFDEDPRIDKWTFSTNGVALCGKHGIPTIGFGPGNEIFAHAPNEAVPIEDLVRCSAFYAMITYSL